MGLRFVFFLIISATLSVVYNAVLQFICLNTFDTNTGGGGTFIVIPYTILLIRNQPSCLVVYNAVLW